MIVMYLPSQKAGYALSAGMVAVLVALAAFAIWAQVVTRTAVEGSKRDVLVSNAYYRARYSLTLELASEREYLLQRDARVRSDVRDAAQQMTDALRTVSSNGTTEDRVDAQWITTQNRRYLHAVRRFELAADRGDTRLARTIDDREMEPLFTSIRQKVTARAIQQSQKTVSELEALHRLQNLIEALTVMAFAAGLLLLALFFRTLQAYRKRIGREVEALQDSEKRYRATFGQAAVGMAHASVDGRWLHVNQKLLDFYGYSQEELATLHFQDITHPDDLDADLVLLGRLLVGEIGSYTMEKRYIRKDGEVVWGRLTISLVRDDLGNPDFTVSIVEDITARKRAEDVLTHQALHDALTDLPNRTLLRDRLQQAILAAERDGRPLALLLMDLNRFKDVNDTFGHHYGDALLQQLGASLHRVLRESDTVARLGGDEFAVLLPATDTVGASLAVGKILSVLERPFEIDGHVFDVGASIGVALYPEHGEDATALMRHADVAMYAAKRSGVGSVTYSLEQDRNDPDRLALTRELRGAADDEQMLLHYLPQVDLKTGGAEQVEALIRWEHPERGFMAPGRFISLAEDTGLMKPLTRWVFGEALRQCAEWNKRGLDIRVAVNVSARSLHDPELVDTIAGALASCGVKPSNLEVEITESSLVVDPDRAMATLSALHDMGVWISIDDFGSGYSSLAHLKRLPIDAIKIDRSFVTDMAANSDNAFIVRSIIELGHNLGLLVVAEGVENQTTMDMLAGWGCDMAQGFYLSRPLSPDAYVRWLNRGFEEAASA